MKRMGLLLVLCLCIATTAMAQGGEKSDIDKVRFLSESWEGITNTDGSGLCWELFRKVYEPVGIEMTFEIVPYARSVRMVQDKQADVTVGVYKDEFDKALFSDWHYLQDIVLVVFKKGEVAEWKGEESLTGRIGWIRGYAFNEYLKKDVKFYETDDRETGLKMLELDRLDFFLDTESELRAALDAGVIDPKDLHVETILKLNVYLAFADNDRGRKLRKIFDDRMAELVKTGELEPLYEKWGLRYPF